ncbi:unnamed protein product [Ambrosiozyma monospora]|uniref:Unnamed protein product n=1 Tax=Ambrosiozyma monospora TaxID=43982 RepID=A0A9W6TAG2_AMBMO|nr:unnamed protein product [Ambrosiozyma monospora]
MDMKQWTLRRTRCHLRLTQAVSEEVVEAEVVEVWLVVEEVVLVEVSVEDSEVALSVTAVVAMAISPEIVITVEEVSSVSNVVASVTRLRSALPHLNLCILLKLMSLNLICFVQT